MITVVLGAPETWIHHAVPIEKHPDHVGHDSSIPYGIYQILEFPDDDRFNAWLDARPDLEDIYALRE